MADNKAVLAVAGSASPSATAVEPGAPGPQQRTDLVRTVELRGRVFRLRRPLEVLSHRDDGGWIRQCPELGIHSYGRSLEEACESFADDFAARWDLIACDADANLSGDARSLKRKLLDLVEPASR